MASMSPSDRLAQPPHAAPPDAAPPGDAAGLEDAHALVVGVSAYRRVRPLPAVQDAQDVAAALADPARCGYPAANVRVLLEEAATRAAIVDALDELAARARPSSTVFVYFSGHGGAAPHAGDGERCYLLPIDGGWDSPAELEATAISGAELSQRLRAVTADRVTIVLDCCRAAGLAAPRDIEAAPLGELTRRALSPLATGRGRAVLAAARADGRAYVFPGQRNGVFTRHLLAGLGGGASRAGGLVRICDLFEYVQERVVAEAPDQRPVFKAELEENYPIARARTPLAAAVAVPPAPDGLAYDVFLSYARRDPEIRAWVERVLVPSLEGCGIELCLEHRDFALGRPRLREMERAVTNSRYTLAVLSPSYVEDGFTEFQSLIAQHLALETREPRLIPLLRRACRLELGTRMTSLLDLTRDEEVPAGLERLALALREPPRPRLDPRAP
jgi:uncharacterized caspase-like protein